MSGLGFFSGGPAPTATDFAFSATPLGVGNLCVVLRARHRVSDRIFAVKRFSKAAIARAAKRAPNIHADILNEKAIASRVSTMCGATLHATFQDSENISFVYDWCDGGELWAAATEAPSAGGEEMFGKTTPADPRYAASLPLEVTRSILAWLSRSLTKLSSVGIAHRDIKPENILLRSPCDAPFNSLDNPRRGADGLPRRPFTLALVDWGSSRDVVTAAATGGSECVGSFEYMAPEAFDNKGAGKGIRVDGRADLWSLGVVAVRLATGVGAWSSDSPYLSGVRASAHQALEGMEGVAYEPVDGLLMAPNTNVHLEAFARALLHRDPAARLGSSSTSSLLLHPYICDAPNTEEGVLVPDLVFLALRASAAVLALAPQLSVSELRRAFALREKGVCGGEGGGGDGGGGNKSSDDPTQVIAWARTSRILRSARPGLQAAILHALTLRRRAALPHIWASFCSSLGAARASSALSVESHAGLRRIGGLSPREVLGWASATDTLAHNASEANALGLRVGAGEKANDWGWLRARGHAWDSSLYIIFVADARLGSNNGSAARVARLITAVNALSPLPRALIFLGDTFGGGDDGADGGGGGEERGFNILAEALDTLDAIALTVLIVQNEKTFSNEDVGIRGAIRCFDVPRTPPTSSSLCSARDAARGAWFAGVRVLTTTRLGEIGDEAARGAEAWLTNAATTAASVARHTLLVSARPLVPSSPSSSSSSFCNDVDVDAMASTTAALTRVIQNAALRCVITPGGVEVRPVLPAMSVLTVSETRCTAWRQMRVNEMGTCRRNGDSDEGPRIFALPSLQTTIEETDIVLATVICNSTQAVAGWLRVELGSTSVDITAALEEGHEQHGLA